MAGMHDSVLVTISIVISTAASYTALDLAGRVRASQGWLKRAWLGAASLAMGGGIWSMHFVAMLAFSMPGMELGYDLTLTLVSLLVAILTTGISFIIMSRSHASLRVLAVSGLLMGFGVVAMHYIGMAAMRMNASISYDRLWISISILIAIGSATAALWIWSALEKLVQF
jgi:NO-binding membrane sensor protein with MHYT domain